MPKVIGFYTYDTPYEAEAKKFVKNVESFGLDVVVQGYPGQGTWVRNAGLKPVFISSMLEKYDDDLLYLDVDARIRKYPSLIDAFHHDVGVHYRRGTELLSGTIFLKNRPEVHAMVKRWVAYQSRHPDTWDQRTLQEVLEDSNLDIFDIPAAYTQIFDRMAHHGEPIIEHMQASRRYKKLVAGIGMYHEEIPNVIARIRIRRGGDGCYFITRRSKEAENFLDLHCLRVKNQLKWYPKAHSNLNIDLLEPIFDGKTVNIVGKGPSLDNLKAEHFPDPDEPIIGINEAVFQVAKLGLPNPIYGIQQDARLKGTCKAEGVPLFVSVKASNFYQNEPDVYVFDSRRYKLPLNALSVTAAIKITLNLKAASYRLVCFDACVNNNFDYAAVIPYPVTWGGSPQRFRSHRAKIQKHVAGRKIEWVIPEGPVRATSGRPRR